MSPLGSLEDDPLSCFEAEPQSVRAVGDSAPAAPVTIAPTETSAIVPPGLDDLRAKLEQVTIDLKASKDEVATIRTELATIVGRVKDIERRSARNVDRLVPRPQLVPGRRIDGTKAGALTLLVLMNGLLWLSPWETLQVDRTPVLSAHLGVGPEEMPAKPAPTLTPAAVPSPPVATPMPTRAEAAPKTVSTAPSQQAEYVGALAIQTDPPGAAVFVNRTAVGSTPLHLSELRAGSHLVWIEHEGYRRWTRVVTVPADQVTQVSAELQPEPASVKPE